MMKVAEGAVNNTVEILKTLKEKAINAATDTNTDTDRATIQKEINQFIDQINDNALATFNGKYLVDGSKASVAVTDTKTVLINQSLSTETTTSTALTKLTDLSGKSLNIVESDTATISVVSQGVTFTTTVTISATTTLNSLLSTAMKGRDSKGNEVTMKVTGAWCDKTTAIGSDTSNHKVYTQNGEAALTISATDTGINNQISGFTITFADRNGNAKKSATEKFEFTTAIFAADKQTEDHAVKIHVGASAGQTITVGLSDMRAESLGLQSSDASVISVATAEKANAAISAFDFALAKALDQATTIGAIQARLDYTASNLTTSTENVQAAESTIRDADMAKEMTNYTKNNVLLQAAQSMLAQANQNSSAVLSLLQ